MFAAFVDIFTMKLSVASGKTYLPIGSVLSVKQAKTLSNPKKKKQRPRRSLKSPKWTMKKWRKRKWKNGNAQSAVTFTKAL